MKRDPELCTGKLEQAEGACLVCRATPRNPVLCSKCGTSTCIDCWNYSGGCPTFGCGERSGDSVSKRPSAPSQEVSLPKPEVKRADVVPPGTIREITCMGTMSVACGGTRTDHIALPEGRWKCLKCGKIEDPFNPGDSRVGELVLIIFLLGTVFVFSFVMGN